eukprot:COSAG06_NODE_4846_length_3911_cov_2.296957_4_plen_77_part_00
MSIDTLVTTDGSTDRVLDETELLEKQLAMEKAARKQVRKTRLLRHLCTKITFLPRQARDKHRENSKKRDRCLAGEA